MKRVINILFGIILTISMFFTIAFTAVSAVANDDAFFRDQYQKNETPNMTGIDLENLMLITDEIQLFLNGDRDDFDIYAVRNDVYRPIFTEKEQLHMDDVQGLFLLFSRVRIYGLIIIVILSIYYVAKDRHTYFLILRIGSIATLSILVILTVAGIWFFEPLFIAFHQIFFQNDLWLLDPYRSVLINMVPQAFFVACAARIAIYTVTAYLAIIIISILCIKKERRVPNESITTNIGN